VRLVLTYASESWTLSKTDKRFLSVFERGILRCNFGAVQENGVWRKRYNHELYELFNEPDIVKYRHPSLSAVNWFQKNRAQSEGTFSIRINVNRLICTLNLCFNVN
jgi:hypothetical protein